MEPIARPMAPMLTPEEVIAGALNPVAASVNAYGQTGIDIARATAAHNYEQQNNDVAHQRAMELLSAKLQNESSNTAAHDRNLMSIAKLHEQAESERASAADRRWENREDARFRQMREEKQMDELRTLQTQLITGHGVVPQRAPGESNDSYREKLVDALTRNQDYQENLRSGNAGAAIDYHEGNIRDLTARQSALQQAEQRRQITEASSIAAQQVINGLDPGDKLAVAIKKKTDAGYSMADAINSIPQLSAQFQERLQAAVALPQVARNVAYEREMGNLNSQLVKAGQYRDMLINSPAGQDALYKRAMATKANAASVTPAAPGVDPLALISGNLGFSPAGNLPAQKPTVATNPNPFITGALAQGPVQDILSAYHPLKKDWQRDAASPEEIIRGASQTMTDRAREIKDELSSMQVQLTPDGRIVVPPTKTVERLSHEGLGFSGTPEVAQRSPQERADTLTKANKLVNELRNLGQNQRTLYMSLAKATRDAAQPSPQVTPQDVIALPPTPAAAAPQPSPGDVLSMWQSATPMSPPFKSY